jgi:hypothetical protein
VQLEVTTAASLMALFARRSGNWWFAKPHVWATEAELPVAAGRFSASVNFSPRDSVAAVASESESVVTE